MAIGRNIRKHRIEKEFTQYFLASELEIDVRTYRKIETEKLDPKLNQIKKLSELFSVPLICLIDETSMNVLPNLAIIQKKEEFYAKSIEELNLLIFELRIDKKHLLHEIELLEGNLKEQRKQIIKFERLLKAKLISP